MPKKTARLKKKGAGRKLLFKKFI